MDYNEDFASADCAFCSEHTIKSIPLDRVIEKLDHHLSNKDYASAERHLEYWLADAEAIGDSRGKLAVLNELVGFYRKQGCEEKALAFADKAVSLARDGGFDMTVTMATTLINAATAKKAFGHAENAVPLFREAKSLYETLLQKDDARLGGLYNNMALCLVDAGDLESAQDLFVRALGVASLANEPTQSAITYCNLADLAALAFGEDTHEGKAKIDEYLKKAIEDFRRSEKRDLSFSYACEKCADVFGYYGHDDWQKELLNYAGANNERT